MSTDLFIFPMSFAQQRLWFLEQMNQGNASYTIAGALRLAGHLDIAALRQALALLVERHESLRTTFAHVDDAPVQLIAERMAIPLAIIRVGEAAVWEDEVRRLAAVEARKPFDLGQGPLVRVSLISRNGHDHVLLATIHHIIADGWSLQLLLRELSLLYGSCLAGADAAAPLPELSIQYADYAQWQREWLQGAELERQLGYWRRQLASPSILRLPTDYPRPALQSHNGSVERFLIPAALAGQLSALSRREEVTLATLLLATYQVLLHRYSGQEDILVGLPVANRSQVEIEGLIGMFANTLVIRANLAGNPSLRELLQQVQRTALEAYEHQDLPFEKLVEELGLVRNLSYPALFQVAFNFQEASLQALAMTGLAVETLDVHTSAAKFDLTLDIEARGGDLSCVIEYNSELFSPTTVAQMALHYQRLLQAFAGNPDCRISSLPLTSAAEQRLAAGPPLQAHAQTTRTSLHGLFEQQVSQHPNAIAVTCGDQQLSYGELDRRANQLAQHLQRLGVGRETLVGLYLERSVELVLAILGILKAGGAYVPLDPAYPRERLALMLEDSKAALVVTTSAMGADLPALAGRQVCLDSDWPAIAACPEAAPESVACPESLAYIIYTSGSTGRPKGVGVTHQNVLRLFWETERWFGFDERDVWTLFHSYAFDFSVWELWGALLYGGRLVVVPFRLSRAPDEFYALLARERVSVLNQTPSAFGQLIQIEEQGLVEPQPLALRYVIFGGEALNPGSLRPWIARHGDQQPQLINMYGITETTVHVTYRPIIAADAQVGQRSPIGGPIPDLSIYVLDHYLNPVPAGVCGEIYVGGAGLARGYLGRPDLTAERFIPNPFDGAPGARLYRTGDIARYLHSGNLEYLGRIDAQVKIRGFRIELGEIESALRQHPAIRGSLTLLREDTPGDRRLVAYLLASDPAPHQDELREFLKRKLPEYMLPASFVVLDAFPLTDNGKVNRALLPAPSQQPEIAAGFAPPRTTTEELLAAIWSKTLGRELVSIHDSFFAIGGDSILSLQVLALARQRGVHFSLQQLFQHPTIAELAESIGREQARGEQRQSQPLSLIADEDRRRLPAGVEDAYPLAMLQAGMLYHMALAPGSNIYHNTDSYHLRTRLPFNFALFQQAVAAVVARHAVLRTGFCLSGYSEPLQLVYREATLPCSLVDIRHLSLEQQERAIHELIEQEQAHHFAIEQPALLRFFIHLRSDDSFQFTLTECHAIIDGWSLQSTLIEIFECYFALLRDKPMPEAAALSVSYRDFIALEREALASQACQQFWAHTLDGAEFLQLPRLPGRPEGSAQQARISSLSIPITAELYAGLQRIVQATALPFKSVLLAAHLKVMGLVSGHSDVLTGVGMNGRPETLDATQLRGLFINTVPLRLRLEPGSWLDLINATFAAEREILPYRRYPAAAIQQQRGRQPLYEVMFNYLHFHVLYGLTEALPDLEELGAIRSEGTNAALLVHFQYHPLTSQMTLDLDYAADQFGRAQIERLGDYYLSVLSAIAADPQQQHQSFSPLGEQERRRLVVEWNLTGVAQPDERCLHQLFEAQARQTPEAVAVEYAQMQWSYRELDQRANWLAAQLRALGAGPDSLVGVYLERGPALMLSLLGVLKAGAAYLPLDPALPAERIRFMLDDAQAGLLLTQQHLAGRLQQLPAGVLLVDDLCWESEASMLVSPPATGVTPDNLIYAIYTSGSTGRPKGTLITQRGAVNYLSWCARTYLRDAGEGMPVYSSIGFDATLMSLFAPLLVGQRVIVLPEEGGVSALGTLLQREQRRLSLIATTPAHLEWLRHMFADRPIASQTGTIISGGELLSERHIAYWRAHAPATRLVNVYGPTETVVASSTYELPDGDALEGGAPIGRPIANTQLYVLDTSGQLAPLGTPGELYIGGMGVARGYLGRPALTAERFVPDPFGAQAGARLYRTGDLVRYDEDGLLEFLGRTDHQVKIRGFRVEPGEIEQALLGLEGVHAAAVTVQVEAGGMPQLVAYVVPAQGAAPSSAALRAALQHSLPDYMLPNSFISLEALPLTVNGKLDRRALPAPARERPELDGDYVLPRSALERTIAALWGEVLKLEQVGIHDNFFELGGHSLLLIQLHALLTRELARELPITALLQYPTVHSLASYLSQAGDDDNGQSQRRIEARRELSQQSRLRDRRASARQAAGVNDD